METKQCPFCESNIPVSAVRCGFCTSTQYTKKELIDKEQVYLGRYIILILLSYEIGLLFLRFVQGDLEETVSDYIRAAIEIGIVFILLIYIHREYPKKRVKKSIPTLLKNTKEHKAELKLMVISTTVFYLLLFSIAASLWLTKPSFQDFKTFLKTEQSFLPAQLIDERDQRFFTTHVVHNEQEYRLYVGAWKRFFLVEQKQINIDLAEAQPKGFWGEIKEFISNLLDEGQ